MMDKLSEEGFFKYKNAIKVETLGMALAAMDHSVDLDAAKRTLKIIKDSYLLSSMLGVKDEGTDHQL
jgi:hypothetical protein